MADSDIQNKVEESIVQAVGHKEQPIGGAALNVMSWLTSTGDTLPPWWSKSRDRVLSTVWKTNNHLATAIYNTQAKLVGIPPRIIARDPSNSEHVAQAETMNYVLSVTPDFGRSWVYTYSKFIEDLLTQDNGAFMEIIGMGTPDGPIVGAPISVRHLDSFRCTRTGNAEFPVLYQGEDDKLYKIHSTRLIFMSQMPSSRYDMFGVGYCAVSRCIEIAKTLEDMVRYKQEKLGSRPANQMLLGKGITAKQIFEALYRQQEEQNNQGLLRYARTVAIGSDSAEVGIDLIDMNQLGPFDEPAGVNLGMYAIASAMGMDADEIWPVPQSGGSKSDSNLRRMRSRGRLPAQVTSELATQFTFKFLPPHLQMIFDFHDDEEDQQRALIRDIRGRNRERDISTGSIHIRTARLRMLNDGDVDRTVFNEMELTDGRLPDGTSIGILFMSPDDVYQRWLGPIESPLNILENIIDEDGLIDDSKVNDKIVEIQAQSSVVLAELAKTKSLRLREKIRNSFWALDWLEEQYNFAAGRSLPSVPMAQRRMRTDIRVVPEEDSPEGVSTAQAAAGDFSENIEVN